MGNLTKGHHANSSSFKRGGIGTSGTQYHDRHCIECGMWKRKLTRRMCDACAKRVKYQTDAIYRRNEIERNRRYRNAQPRGGAKGELAHASPAPSRGKEEEMAMAIRILSRYPINGYPDARDWAMTGKLLCMAYEDFPRFWTVGMPMWRNYIMEKMKVEIERYQNGKVKILRIESTKWTETLEVWEIINILVAIAELEGKTWQKK